MALNKKDRIAVAVALLAIAALSLARLGFTRLARGDNANARSQASRPAPDAGTATVDPAVAVPRSTEPADVSQRLIEICGLGRVAVAAQGPIDVSPFMKKIVGDAQSRWMQRLANSGELRARAAGLLLEQHDTLVARDALVQLAVGSGDPALYALAYAKCQGSSDAPCRQVGSAAWARLDRDNAAPWLLAAAELHQNGNRFAEAAAIARAAQAHRLDSYNFSLSGFSIGEIPRDLGDAQRYFLEMGMLGIDATTIDAHMGEGIRFCREEVPRNTAARPQCAALAQLFADKGSLLIDQMAAASIGSYSGWSAERVAQKRLEVKALTEATAIVSSVSDPADSWSCDAMTRANRYFRRMASQGEVGAAREAQQSLGIDTAELARRYEERNAQFIERARADQAAQPQVAP